MANSLTTLLAKAKVHAAKNKGRLIFGFDATASRGPSWTTARELQTAMFAGISNLDVQLCVFRGDAELLVSDWESEPSALQALMGEISVMGGNTQMVRLFQHILDESAKRPVNAFVFIGDTFEEQRPAALAQCKALGDLKIPGFFFLDQPEWRSGDAHAPMARFYSEMAKLTGGAFAPFNSASAAFLADLLRSVAGFASGGLAALADRNSPASRLLLSQMKKD